MDLYAIHKTFSDMQQQFGSSSDRSDAQDSRNREEMARLNKLINMAIFNGQIANPSNLRTYHLSYDPLTEGSMPQFPIRPSSTEFNPNLLLPFGRNANNNPPNHSGTTRVTLADQFTWGAVVCAGVFVVVFICVMAAWWVHKKQQARARRRITEREARRQAAEGPYCIENDMNGMSNVDIDIPRPPSYFEVIGFFDPPPSYNDVLRVGGSASQQQVEANQAYENTAVTIDELPPPFVEGDYYKSVGKTATSNGPEPSAISSLSSNNVTVIPARERHDVSNS